jgi:hypothetical protein
MQAARSAAVLVFVGAAFLTPAWAQTLTRLSVDAAGAQANGPSSSVAASSDGRWVVFSSAATNLVANDTNGALYDVFLLDRTSSALELVSVDSSGAQHATDSSAAGVSDDGRFIAFLSDALDAGDTDFTRDVYLRDRQTGVTHWVSQENAADDAWRCTLSRDGLTVAYSGFSFSSFGPSFHVRRPFSGGQWSWVGSNLSSQFSSASHGALAANGQFVAVHTSNYNGYSTTRWTELLDLNSGVSTFIAEAPFVTGISYDAGFIAYVTAGGLTARELATGIETVMIPGAISGVGLVHLSDDGRYAAFESDAADLVAGDTNAAADVFLHDRSAHTTLRVSVSAAGAQASGASSSCVLLGDGSRVLFASVAGNLAPGDTNGVDDVFERTNCFPHAVDLDGDGYGAGATSLVCIPVAPGLVPNTLDCDDADPARSPSALEVCNGIDDDCDGSVDEGFQGAPYCANSSSSSGCVPQIEALGSPRASATSGFTVRVTQMNGQRAGVLFYGLAPTALPWAPLNPSTLCVAGQRQRMGISTSSGTPNLCDGVIARDVLAWAAATPGALATPFSAGTTLYFQGWLRDPLMPSSSILTSGWSTTLCP